MTYIATWSQQEMNEGIVILWSSQGDFEIHLSKCRSLGSGASESLCGV